MGNSMKLFSVLILLLFMSCDDILEENITDDLVTLITPTSESVIANNVVNFAWNPIGGAENYRLQVLDATQNHLIVLDSLVSETSFQHPLDPGSYEWRIRGENFAYETAYSFPISFTVIASSDLTNQSVILNTPTANLYTNSTNIVYTWNALPFADSYTFELIKNLNGQTTVAQQTGITATNYSANASVFDVDAEYIWKVKAINTNTETGFTTRSIYIDRVAPNQPTLVTPADDEIITELNIDFNWTLGQDSGNIQSDVVSMLEIALDANFNTIIETITVNNGTSQQVSIPNIDTYFWRVRAKDAAQNVSSYSTVRTFVTQ